MIGVVTWAMRMFVHPSAGAGVALDLAKTVLPWRACGVGGGEYFARSYSVRGRQQHTTTPLLMLLILRARQHRCQFIIYVSFAVAPGLPQQKTTGDYGRDPTGVTRCNQGRAV